MFVNSKRKHMAKLSENQKKALTNTGKAILIWLMVMLIGWFVFGCKSIQTEVQYQYRDSVITHTVYDTSRVTVTDTIHVEASNQHESENQTEIQFGAGGGTYNAQTGEATNVVNVKQSSKEKELQQIVLNYRHAVDSTEAKCDSLYAANRDLQEQIEHKENTKDITPRSGWDKFCTWWFVGSCIVLLLLLAYGCWRLYRKFYLHV